jgi:hypothetical protein
VDSFLADSELPVAVGVYFKPGSVADLGLEAAGEPPATDSYLTLGFNFLFQTFYSKLKYSKLK